MNILCTGGRGFIGLHLMPHLLSKGHTVHCYDLIDHQSILDKKKLERIIVTKNISILYHLAALTDVQQSFSHQNAYYETNVIGTMNALSLCALHDVQLIYTSTAAIYQPHSSPYAHSKHIAELLIQSLLPSSVILRLFNVYGEGMNPTTMLARFQRENPITIYGDGKQTRDFIHVDDVVSIMVSAMGTEWNEFIGDVGTGKSQSVLSIAKRFKKPITWKYKRQEVRESKANIKKLRKLYTKPFMSLNSYIDKFK